MALKLGRNQVLTLMMPTVSYRDVGKLFKPTEI